MGYTSTQVQFTGSNYSTIISGIIDAMLNTGLVVQESAGVLKIGNCSHRLKISYAGTGNAITFDIMNEANTGVLFTSAISVANSGWMRIKMVYSINGLGVTCWYDGYNSESVDILCLKGLNSQNGELWTISPGSSTQFVINGSDATHTLTNSNLIYDSPGQFKATPACLYTNAAKTYVGKLNLIAGNDSLGALSLGGIGMNTIVRLDSTHYLWKARSTTANNVNFVSDLAF